MSIHKKQYNVKPFKFGELVPSEKSDAPLEEIAPYKMKSLKEAASFKNNITADIIRQDRHFERNTSFNILPLVREHRGIIAQEQQDYKNRVHAEVEKRVTAIAEKARTEGYHQGHQEGYSKAYEEAMIKIETKVDQFVEILQGLGESMNSVMAQNKKEAYEMIRNLTKWIILKEVENKEYVERLLEKLILEMNSKNNLVVRVNQEVFKYMPEIIEKIEAKLGQLTNVRLEVDLDQHTNGIILESENGMIDGSINAQMRSLDKLFEAVGINE